jgi:hypothetical protein
MQFRVELVLRPGALLRAHSYAEVTQNTQPEWREFEENG